MTVKYKSSPLLPGSTLGIIAPATACMDFNYLPAIEQLTNSGYKLKMTKTLIEHEGYLAGSDELRARELQRLFLDDDVDAILCYGGGYGCARLLPLLDKELIKKHPKTLIGYSDVTALHIYLQEQCDINTIHGPMLKSFAKRPTQYTISQFFTGLSCDEPIGAFAQPKGYNLKTLYPGTVSGPIIGGNLAIIASLVGTPYELRGDNAILFIEEIAEDSYKIDRLLNQLLQNGLFDRVKGIVFGEFTKCLPIKPEPYEFTVEEVIKQYCSEIKLPAISGLAVGHERHNGFLPFGVQATINAEIEGADLFIKEAHFNCK